MAESPYVVVALVGQGAGRAGRPPRPLSRRHRGRLKVHREQQVLRHQLPRDVAVPRHMGRVHAQEHRLRAVPHRTGLRELRDHQARRVARGVGARHRPGQGAHQGHAQDPRVRVRAFRLPHPAGDGQDDHARQPCAGHLQARQRGSRQAALHRLPRLAGAPGGAGRDGAAGQLDAVVLHLPHRRHQELQLLPHARRTAIAARARTVTTWTPGSAARTSSIPAGP